MITFDEVLAPEDTAAVILDDIAQLAGAARRWQNAVARKSGQTHARWRILTAVLSGNRSVPQIARRLGLTRQAVQRVADQLVEEGRVRYVRNNDRPSSPRLCLTTRGRDRLDRMDRAAAVLHQDLAAGLHPDDLRAASTVLRKFREHLERTPLPTQE